MTLPEFSNVFALLAIQLRATDADEGTIRGYFEALKDLDVAFISAAAERLSRTAEWFPKTSEWRRAAEAICADRLEAQKAWLRDARQPLCSRCDDTGWERLAIVENGQPVTRVKACACRVQRWRELTGSAPFPALPSGDAA